MLGEYSEEDVTVLAFTGNVVASLAGADFVLDLRDVTYDLTHWGQEEYFMIHLATDVIALVPVVGMIKYLDHFKVAKAGIKTADMVDSIADIGKNTEATVDVVEEMVTTAKLMDKIEDIIDDTKNIGKNSEMAKKFIRILQKVIKLLILPISDF